MLVSLGEINKTNKMSFLFCCLIEFTFYMDPTYKSQIKIFAPQLPCKGPTTFEGRYDEIPSS